MQWCIYYGDPENDFCSWDGDIDLAPKLDVQCINQGSEWLGREMLIQKDYYWWNSDEDRWYGGDLFGLYDYLLMPGLKVVLFGRFVNRDVYNDAVRRAQKDDRLPRKSAYSKQEASAYPNGLEEGT